jgi:cell division septation protein DedD
MMTSILNLESAAPPQVQPVQDAPREQSTGTGEYEIVVGRAQIASWLFVGLVVVAICSSLAYLAGQTITAQKTARVAAVTPLVSAAPPASVTPAVLPQASILVPPKTDLTSLVKTAKPAPGLFAEPEIGKVYLQIGAVERGMAMLLTEGLRSHGFDSFVAPGPNERIFRVLIGPLPDPEAFRQGLAAVSALDLATFARKYQK